MAALAGLIAACIGCAEGIWRHRSHNDMARFKADSEHCESLAGQLAFNQNVYRRVPLAQQQAVVDDIFMQCMYRLGYYRARQSAPPPAK